MKRIFYPQSRSDFDAKVVRHFRAGFLLCMAALSALSASASRVEAKPPHSCRTKTLPQRRSVIDYFNLLPTYGIGYSFGDSATRKERRELLQSGINPDTNPIIDVRHDYLLIHPDSSPAEQIAVFRARGKSDVVAVSMPNSESNYNDFVLYRLQNGRLPDVTGQMLPVPAQTDHFLYLLPEFGTTIRVYRFKLSDGSRRHAFDLQWHEGRFVKVPSKV